MSRKRKPSMKAQLDAISVFKLNPKTAKEGLFTNLKKLSADCDDSDLVLATTKAKEALLNI